MFLVWQIGFKMDQVHQMTPECLHITNDMYGYSLLLNRILSHAHFLSQQHNWHCHGQNQPVIYCQVLNCNLLLTVTFIQQPWTHSSPNTLQTAASTAEGPKHWSPSSIHHSDLQTATFEQWPLSRDSKTATSAMRPPEQCPTGNGFCFDLQLSSETTHWSAKQFTLFITASSSTTTCSCRSHDVHVVKITQWRDDNRDRWCVGLSCCILGSTSSLCWRRRWAAMLWNLVTETWEGWTPRGACCPKLAECLKLEWGR